MPPHTRTPAAADRAPRAVAPCSRTRAWAAGLLLGAAGLVGLLTDGAASQAGTPPPIGSGQGGVAKQVVASGLDQPIYVTTQPGDSSILYVVEKPGTVQTVVGGVVGAQPFLDITGLVSEDGERGLLSIAFDPNFDANGLFYAYYTNNAGDILISEFHATSDTDADEASRRRVITIPHPDASNHNGGTAVFGPDGFLYAAPGDGGGGGDPSENAQNLRKLLGKLLRIDPHGAGPGDYTVPPDNPFVGIGGRDEIYARGLRNPFRFSFDPVTGRIAIGDVGQDEWEEVDYEGLDLRKANFGWDRFEGLHRFDEPGDNEAATPSAKQHDKPIFEYPHPPAPVPSGNVITGGLVVRDESLTTLYGRYLYADEQVGHLRSFVPKLGGAQDDQGLGVNVQNPTAFVAAADGTVYVTSLTTPPGTLYRLVPE